MSSEILWPYGGWHNIIKDGIAGSSYPVHDRMVGDLRLLKDKRNDPGRDNDLGPISWSQRYPGILPIPITALLP